MTNLQNRYECDLIIDNLVSSSMLENYRISVNFFYQTKPTYPPKNIAFKRETNPHDVTLSVLSGKKGKYTTTLSGTQAQCKQFNSKQHKVNNITIYQYSELEFQSQFRIIYLITCWNDCNLIHMRACNIYNKIYSKIIGV